MLPLLFFSSLFGVGGLSDSSAAGLSPLAMFTDLVFLCERFATLEAQLSAAL